MSLIVTIALYALALISVLFGVVVFLRNPKSRTQLLFLALSSCIGLWITSNALFGHVNDGGALYVLALLSYMFAAATAVSFFFFVVNVSGAVRRQLVLRVLSTVFVFVAGVPGLLATGVDDHRSITTTPFILVYAAIMAAYFVSGIWILLVGARRQRGQRRQQLTAIFLGLLGGILGGVFFNLILPIYGDYRFVQLGPAFSVLFVIASAYAIVRHRLFDFRAAILRAVAYALAVLTIATLYIIAAYAVSAPFLGQPISFSTQLVYLILAVLAALTFQPVKRFFDKATRAVFYKDAYNPQHVIDHLGDILVREVSVTRLVRRSVQLIVETVKPAGASIVIVKDHTQTREITHGQPLKQAGDLVDMFRKHHTGFVVTDEIADNGSQLHSALSLANVAVVAPLITSNATVGYLLVGYKASGDAFSTQDLDLLKIFADELAVAVQNALRFEEISHFNVTLRDEVDDATSKLRASNRKLHQLDEVKDEFISMASHQLRTPLTSIKGYLSMVLEGDAGKITADQRKLLEEAFSSSQRMVYLIGDFLNISRLQTGKFELELTDVNLAGLVTDEVEQLKATAQRRNITLDYKEPAQFPAMSIDEAKIRQVVMNFIDNAIFYSHPNSTVTIELTTTGRNLRLEVTDTGIGVPQSERHHLFTKFYRATNARKIRPDGTGIGLYMAKKVVTAFGGSIIFESKEGKGSTFGFTLPLKH